MKKLLLFAVVVLALAVAVPVMACDDMASGLEEGVLSLLWDTNPDMKDSGNRKGEMQAGETVGQLDNLFLVQKIPFGDWPIVPDGAWGRLVFFGEDSPNNEFAFGGYDLDAGREYVLISYKESNGIGSPVLGTGVTDTDYAATFTDALKKLQFRL